MVEVLVLFDVKINVGKRLTAGKIIMFQKISIAFLQMVHKGGIYMLCL